ncbi:MAG: hypothetical protein ACK5NG_01450, partial [Chthoniobacterales bacterium]
MKTQRTLASLVATLLIALELLTGEAMGQSYTLYKPISSELSAPDQENYAGYVNNKNYLIDDASPSIGTSINTTTRSMLWSDNLSSLGNPNVADYDPIHNTLIFTASTALNDVTGIALWAPDNVRAAYGDAPIKDFK